MSGGFDTRTAMDGFARGMQVGNSTFDRVEEKRRYEKKEGIANADRKKKKNIEDLTKYSESIYGGADLSDDNWLDFKRIAKEEKINFGQSFNEDTDRHFSVLDQFIEKAQAGESVNINDPEVVTAMGYIFKDELNEGRAKGEEKMLTGIMPAPKKGENGQISPSPTSFLFDVDVVDKKTGKVLRKGMPKTENNGTEADGDNNVKTYSADKIIKRMSALRMMRSFAKNMNPESYEKNKGILAKLGLYKPPPKRNIKATAWDEGHLLYDSNTGEKIRESGQISKGYYGSKKYKTDNNDFQKDLGTLAKIKMKVAEDGSFISDEEARGLTIDFVNHIEQKYNIDQGEVQNMLEDLQRAGSSKGVDLKFAQEYSKAKREELSRLEKESEETKKDTSESLEAMEGIENSGVSKPRVFTKDDVERAKNNPAEAKALMEQVERDLIAVNKGLLYYPNNKSIQRKAEQLIKLKKMLAASAPTGMDEIVTR